MSAAVPGGLTRRTLLGAALLGALPGLAGRGASAASLPAFDGAQSAP